MAGCGFSLKRRDLNRYRKVYPYLRVREKYAYLSDSEAVFEFGSIDFSNTDTGTYTYTEVFPATPNITSVSVDIGNNQAGVNIFVSSINSTSVTFKSSQSFTGKVDFHIIYTPCT